MAKSLTMRSVRCCGPASWTAASVTDMVRTLSRTQPHKLQERLRMFARNDQEIIALGLWPPGSEQLDVHDRARGDGVDIGGNLDVAVGARHARDVARCFECGHRHAIFDAYRIELMPARCRHHACGK